MKKKKAKEVMKDFYNRYQENPKGWSLWISPPSDSDGFYEVYIVRGDEAFFLKLDSIYTPNPVGIGTKLEIEEDQLEKDLPDFGFRRFNEKETKDFLESIPNPQDYDSKEDFENDLKQFRENIVGEALSRDPVPFESSGGSGGLMAIGPYSSESPLSYISERQEELRKELSKELDKMVKRNYPGHY